MPLYHRLRAAHVTLLLLATIDATMVSAQQMDGWPDWLIDGMARETTDLESRVLSVGDGKYRFRLAGETGEPVEFDGGWYFESDIGADAPLECYLYTEEKDLATFIVNLADTTMEAQGEAYGRPAGDPSLFTVDAGAIDDAPYLALEWIYTLGEAPNLLIGLVKARAAVNGDVVQACVHNLVGYRDTFEAAFDEFVRSAEVPDRAAPAYYEEIAIQSLGDTAAGYAHARYAQDAEGDSQIYMRMASLIPTGTGGLSYKDSRTISWSSPDGQLINTFTADSQNGTLVTNLQMDRDANSDWLVSGTYKGTAFEQVIDGLQQPLTEVGQMQVVRELFASEATEATFPIWLADADPTQILAGTLTRADATVTGEATLTLGPMSFDARFDDDGALTKAVIDMGDTRVSIDRIWSRGAPR